LISKQKADITTARAARERLAALSDDVLATHAVRLSPAEWRCYLAMRGGTGPAQRTTRRTHA